MTKERQLVEDVVEEDHMAEVDNRFEHRQQNERKQGNKSGVQCYYCKKFGHVKADCWKREKQANYAEHEEEKEVKLFMAYEKNATARNNI